MSRNDATSAASSDSIALDAARRALEDMKDFTPQARDAWIAAYSMMASVMQQGSREVPVGAAA